MLTGVVGLLSLPGVERVPRGAGLAPLPDRERCHEIAPIEKAAVQARIRCASCSCDFLVASESHTRAWCAGASRPGSPAGTAWRGHSVGRCGTSPTPVLAR